MNDPVLLDTHVWAWTLGQSARLSEHARKTIAAARAPAISPVSIYEIAQKVRLGKWAEMAELVPRLTMVVAEQGGLWADVTPQVAHLAGSLDWPHRDPFDRLLAATALVNGWVLISADTAFDSLIGLRRIW